LDFGFFAIQGATPASLRVCSSVVIISATFKSQSYKNDLDTTGKTDEQ